MSNQIKLYVDNVSTLIAGTLDKEIYKDLKKCLGYLDPQHAFKTKHGRKQFGDGWITCVCYSEHYCKCPIKKSGMHFPSGVASKAAAFFKLNFVPFTIEDVRDKSPLGQIGETGYTLTKFTPEGKPFALFDYQDEIVNKAIKQQRGVLQSATGSGKSIMIAAIVARLGLHKTIIYVTSNDLLNQMYNDLRNVVKDKDGNDVPIGRIGGGYKDIQDITVVTVQTAIRALGEDYEKVDDEDEDDNTDISDMREDIANLIMESKVCIFDECHHVKSKTAQVIAGSSQKAFFRFGCSATPYRDQGDDILIEACFGKKICEVSASYLIQRGFLVKPQIAFIHIDNMAGQKLGQWQTVYKQAIVENDYRNEVIAKLAMNLKAQGRNVLILVQQIDHGNALNALIDDSTFLSGKDSTKKERKDHIEKLRNGHGDITIASSIFDEGVDCKPLDALILAGGGKSPVRALQRVGRVIRTYTYPDGTKKENALIYDFYDHQKYLDKHAEKRKSIYKSETEFEVTDAYL